MFETIKAVGPPQIPGVPHAIKIEYGNANTFYLSGVVGITIEDGVKIPDSFEEEVRLAFKYVKNIVEEAKGTMENVVRLEVYLKASVTGPNWNTFKEVQAEFFSGDYSPARIPMTVLEVAANANVMLGVVAVV